MDEQVVIEILKAVAKEHIEEHGEWPNCIFCQGDQDDNILPDFVKHEARCPTYLARGELKKLGIHLYVYHITIVRSRNGQSGQNWLEAAFSESELTERFKEEVGIHINKVREI